MSQAVSNVLAVAIILVLGPLITAVLRTLARLPLRSPWFFVQWLCSDIGGVLGFLPDHEWLDTAAWGASGLLALFLWWRSGRRKRKRSLKALGHKARAKLAELVRNMPKPGPLLRPAPQGSPA